MAKREPIRLVLLFNPASAGMRSMVDGILAARTSLNFQVITSDLPGLRPVVAESQDQADAWLMFAGSREVAQRFARLQHKTPIVNLSAGLGDNPMPSVWPDNEEIGRLAAEHLLATGLSRFGFAGDPGGEHYSALRLRGFRGALADRPCAVLDRVPRGVPDTAAWHALRKDLVRWLTRLPKPCGVLAADDARAVMVSRACHKARLRVPEDVAIVGVNNEEALCAFGDPPLTSVALPWRQIGVTVAELMARILRGRARPGKPIIINGARLIERRSTQTVAVDAPDLAKAIRFIRETASHRPVSLTEVTAHVLRSRSTVERGFRRCLGHAIGEEIARTRERHLRRMLCETALSVKQIAAAMGFRSVGDLSRFCLNRTGHRPVSLRASQAKTS